MENWKFEDLCVDTMWQIVYAEASYFNKKINLISYIYGNIVEKIEDPKSLTLSTLAKKKLLENNLVKQFAAIRDAGLKTIANDTTPSTADVDGQLLNTRGFARLSVLSNINADIYYSPKTNKNIYLALANALKNFSLDGTDYEGKGFFEVIVRYLEKHQVLVTSNPRQIANSFCSNIENEEIMKKLDDSFQSYLIRQVRQFQKDMYSQNCDDFSINVISEVISEVNKEYSMFSANFNSVLSNNIPKKILDKYNM